MLYFVCIRPKFKVGCSLTHFLMFELENFAFSWWKIDWCPLFVIVLLLWSRKIMAAGFWFLYTIIAFHFTKLYIPKKITAFLLRSVYALSYFMWKNWKLEWNRLMVKTSASTCLSWPLKPSLARVVSSVTLRDGKFSFLIMSN